MVDTDLRYKTLQDLSRILTLFEVQDIEERSVSDIAKSLQLLPSKASRMLRTLESERLLERSSRTGRYRIGARFLQIGLLYALNHPLRRVILPHLEQTAKDLGLLSAWGIFGNGRAIIIDRVRFKNGPPVHLLGSDVPLHSSSYGKLFLAYLPVGEREKLLRSIAFVKLTPATIETAIDDGETREGLVGMAAPVFGENGRLAAALTVSGRKSEFSKDRLTETAYLKEKALFISRQIGYKPNRDAIVL
jgi:IclR family transcriptional regulator, KDG regulon repressor